MLKSIVDTDTLSFYFRGEQQVVGKVDEYLKIYDQLNISIITYYEILGGLKYKNATKQLNDFEEFVSNNHIIPLTEESARISSDKYAALRQAGITIGASDILIAGIAIENDLCLVTNNERHYQAIRNLRIENWKK